MSLNVLDETESPLNIIQIPKDLLIHTFQYLEIYDIHRIQNTCRLFCAVAHDPNSLWRLVIDLDKFYGDPRAVFMHYHRYNEPKYSKVKVLQFEANERDWEEHCAMIQALPPLTHIQCLYLNGCDNRTVPDDFFKFTVGTHLQTVQLNHMDILSVIAIITKCKHIQTLILTDTYANSHAQGILNQLTIDNSESEHCLMPNLQTLTIERWSTVDPHFRQLVYWILANGRRKKTFSVLDHSHKRTNLSLFSFFLYRQ
eukprot:902583_1